MRTGLVVLSSLALAACGAAGTPPQTMLQYELLQQEPAPAAPLAAGQSVTVHFRERVCHLAAHPQPNRPGNFDTQGCDAPYTPASLSASVSPISATGAPCGATASVTGPGAVLATKTGAGDPRFNGTCSIGVFDPGTGASSTTPFQI